MTTEAIIAAIAKLTEKLSKFVKNKEVFDVVREIQTYQKELETNATQAESKVTKLEEEMAHSKQAHSQEIARLRQGHAEEIARLKLDTPTEEDNRPRIYLSRRPAQQTEILKTIAEIHTPTTEQIAGRIGHGLEATKFHLEELRTMRFITSSQGQHLETYWHLAHQGRGYMIQNGLLK